MNAVLENAPRRPRGAFLWVLPLVWAGTLGSLRAQTPAPVSGTPCTALTYSTNPHYPPYDWSEDEKVFLGASIELLSMVLPPKVQAKPLVVPWKRALVLAEEGSVDLLLSLRKTPERAAVLAFTRNRAFPNPIVVFVRKDKAFRFQSWPDLKDRRGGISQGDTFGAGFDEYWRAELKVEEAHSLEENFKKLRAGRIDYFISGLFLGQSYIAREGLADELVPLGKPISNQDIYFAFSRKYDCAPLKAEVDRRLQELNRKGVPERLLQKYLDIYAVKKLSGP